MIKLWNSSKNWYMNLNGNISLLFKSSYYFCRLGVIGTAQKLLWSHSYGPQLGGQEILKGSISFEQVINCSHGSWSMDNWDQLGGPWYANQGPWEKILLLKSKYEI